MISLTVKAVDGEADKYGKTVNELQTGIVIDDEEETISGTLLHVDNYQNFSGITDEQTGNYLALEVEVPDEATITTKLIGGTHESEIDLTTDKYCVYRITDEQRQQIQFTVTKGQEKTERTYDLTGLTLNKS